MLGRRVHYPDPYRFRYLISEIILNSEYLFECNTEDPLIFDCGANIGVALLYFLHTFPKARVIAFEPTPETFRYLSQNSAGFNGVECHNAALSNKDGVIPFYIPPGSAGSLTTSICPNRVEGLVPIDVIAVKLSTYISQPVDLLKIDVEGAEWQVFEDLIATKKINLIRNAIIEYHHQLSGESRHLSQFLAMLENAGFAYQIHARHRPILRPGVQDILIGAYRPREEQAA